MDTTFWHLSNGFVGAIEIALILMVASEHLKRRSFSKWTYYGLCAIAVIIIYIIGLFFNPSTSKMILVTLINLLVVRMLYEGNWKTCIAILLGYLGVSVISDHLIFILWGGILPSVYVNAVQYNAIWTLLGVGAKIITIIQIHLYYRFKKRKNIPFAWNQCILHLAPVITLMTIHFNIKYNPNVCTTMKESVLLISCVMGLLGCNVFTWNIFESMIESDREKRRYKYLQDKMKEQYSYYRNIEKNQLEVSQIWHDMHNHINCLEVLIQQNNLDEAKMYIGQVNEKIVNLKGGIRTGNLIIDAVLVDKYTLAVQRGIKMKVQVIGEVLQFMRDIDLCTIYGNLLDNALEACSKMKEQDQDASTSIWVKTSEMKGVTVIEITNTYSTPIIEKDGILQTTKLESDMHGIGLGNIKNVVKTYDGELHIRYDENFFNVKIIF